MGCSDASAPARRSRGVEGVAKANEWARKTPREEVVAGQEALSQKRKRNEDGSGVKYWKSTGIAGRGGLIADKEFEVWLDWLVRDGDWPRDRSSSRTRSPTSSTPHGRSALIPA